MIFVCANTVNNIYLSSFSFIQSLFLPCGDFMSKIHTNYTVQLYIKGPVTSDNLIGEIIYIHVRKKEKARKKSVIS